MACETGLLPASFAQVERSRITYGSSGHVVPAAATHVLEEVAGYVSADSTVTRVYVAGHTDDKGLARDNVTMSRRRAEAVTAYLVDTGIPAEMIVTRHHGGKYPAVPNASAGERARNRRTTVRLTREPIEAPEAAGGEMATTAEGVGVPGAERGRSMVETPSDVSGPLSLESAAPANP